MTVHDALEARTSPADLRRVADALTAALPVGRAVRITSEVIDAAAAGDLGLLAALLAEEVEPDEVDLELLRGIDGDRQGAVSGDEMRRELGISRADSADMADIAERCRKRMTCLCAPVNLITIGLA